MNGEFNLVVGALNTGAGDLLATETDSDITSLLQKIIAPKQRKSGNKVVLKYTLKKAESNLL